MDQSTLDILDNLLTLDPNRRLTAAQVEIYFIIRPLTMNFLGRNLVLVLWKKCQFLKKNSTKPWSRMKYV